MDGAGGDANWPGRDRHTAGVTHAALTRRQTLNALDAPVLAWRALRMGGANA